LKKGFKYRMGIEEQPIVLIDELHDGLRLDLWNHFHVKYIEKYRSLKGDLHLTQKRTKYNGFFKTLFWSLGGEVDTYYEDTFFEKVKDLFKHQIYFEVLQFMEKIIEKSIKYQIPYSEEFYNNCQKAFASWNSPYRFIKGEIVPISNMAEIEELKRVESNSINYHIDSVKVHLLQSLKHLKPDGDLRNSIKESISMVESVARLIAPTENTLGKALKRLAKDGKVNPLLNESNLQLYKYSNSTKGIRHALMEEEDLSLEDARYFLISCSAFTNYLFEKGRKANVFKKE